MWRQNTGWREDARRAEWRAGPVHLILSWRRFSRRSDAVIARHTGGAPLRVSRRLCLEPCFEFVGDRSAKKLMDG
jgi:hypothetical protein